MSFWLNVVSIFIGAFLGFSFSICLFYLTRKWEKHARKKFLEQRLKKEFEFNEHYLGLLLKDLNKNLEKINADDKRVSYYIKYRNYQSLFILTYFQEGFLYDKLDSKDINTIIAILNGMSTGMETYINNSIQNWRNGKLEKKDIAEILTFERDNIEKYIEDLNQIKQKIVPQ